MERSLSTKLQEKEETPTHPDDNRSTKKVKIRDGAVIDDSDMLSYDPIASSDEEMSAEGDSLTHTIGDTEMASANSGTRSAPSFKDMLLNLKAKQKEDDEDFSLLEGDVIINKEGPFPSINFSARVHQLLNESMKYAVVIKMLGRNIRYVDLRDKVVSLWKLTGSVHLSDLEGNCFIAKLDNEKDYYEVLLGGPWVIFGHYLTVQPWTPDFSPLTHTTSHVMGWVRIPGLPAKYYKKSVIRAIGEVLGKVFRIDYNTASGERGKFARMAVLIDLSKALTSKIVVDNQTLYVEYEGLPTICYCCGHYGHLENVCRRKNGAPSDSTSLAVAQPAPMTAHVSQQDEQKDELYGSWMQVPARGRRRPSEGRRTAEHIFSKGVNQGTRFDLLRSEDAGPDATTGTANDGKLNVNYAHAPTQSKVREKDTKLVKPHSNKHRSEPYPSSQPKKSHPVTKPNSDTIFASRPLSTDTPPLLDPSLHKAISIPNPRPALKPISEPKLRTQNTQPLDTGKENAQPKAPDPDPSGPKPKSPSGISLKNAKSKSKEVIPSLADEVLKAIVKSLDQPDGANKEGSYENTNDDEDDEGQASMEC